MRHKRVLAIRRAEKAKPEGTTSTLIDQARRDYIINRNSQKPKPKISRRQARLTRCNKHKRAGFPADHMVLLIKKRVQSIQI